MSRRETSRGSSRWLEPLGIVRFIQNPLKVFLFLFGWKVCLFFLRLLYFCCWVALLIKMLVTLWANIGICSFVESWRRRRGCCWQALRHEAATRSRSKVMATFFFIPLYSSWKKKGCPLDSWRRVQYCFVAALTKLMDICWCLASGRVGLCIYLNRIFFQPPSVLNNGGLFQRLFFWQPTKSI